MNKGTSRLRVTPTGGGWSVRRDGETVPGGVHKSKGSAYDQALALSDNRPELIDVDGGLEGTDRDHYGLK
jgi:hypothetical protein